VGMRARSRGHSTTTGRWGRALCPWHKPRTGASILLHGRGHPPASRYGAPRSETTRSPARLCDRGDAWSAGVFAHGVVSRPWPIPTSRCPADMRACAKAASRRRSDVLMWLRDKACARNHHTHDRARAGPGSPLLGWVMENGCPHPTRRVILFSLSLSLFLPLCLAPFSMRCHGMMRRGEKKKKKKNTCILELQTDARRADRILTNRRGRRRYRSF
jgi:hypothetical protein